MSRRTSADRSDDYTDEDTSELFRWLLAAAVRGKYLAAAPGSGEPTGRAPSMVDVKARIEWQGEDRGTRSVTFGGGSTGGLARADMRRVLVAVAAARDAIGRARDARPLVSYRDRTPRAQWNKLASTRAGRAALAEARVTPSRSTLRAWSRSGVPARSPYAAAIARAYEARRTAETRAATSGAQAAVAAVATLFTEALAQAYDGADIRIRDIERLNLWD